MASGGSDRDAKYALSKLLQMGTVAEYEREFVILANRVKAYKLRRSLCLKHGCQDVLKRVTTTSAVGKKGDLGVITFKGGPLDHMQASEKKLDALKSLLKQKSMFRPPMEAH
ncbi:hypothetical protein Tco_1027116 [Tanacetum coccineum]